MTELEQTEVKLARLQEQLAGAREAVSLQAREYERRLGELNHNASQSWEELRKMQDKYVPLHVWEIQHEVVVARIAKLERSAYVLITFVALLEIVLRFVR